MGRVFNFSPGPAMLPEAVMQTAQHEFCDWHGKGVSIMEISHRGPDFIQVAAQAEQTLRQLLSIPDNYRVLFLQGGAQLQNAAVPMNILGEHTRVNYAVTGTWSSYAAGEASKYAEVVTAFDTNAGGYTEISARSQWQIDHEAAYFFYCDNETVHGVEFAEVPDVELPLVCDMSSNLLTRPVDVSKFGLIFACAQKNFGPAGVTVVIVRDDLLQREPNRYLPSVMDYRLQAAADSMKNTPPTFAWYMAGLVFEWIKEQGGVAVMDQLACQRAALIYDYLDHSQLFNCPVAMDCRSRLNIVFDLVDEQLNAPFLKLAEQHGLLYLKGHRSRGGMRASLYNAMPMAGAEALVELLEQFEQQVR